MTQQPRSGSNKRLTGLDALASSGLVNNLSDELQDVSERYAISVPAHLANLINVANPSDPIARQIIPDVKELITTPDENADPIGDHTHSPVKGLVHRYPDRVLLKVHSACAVYCRFCFRREMVGPGGDSMNDADLEAAFTYIADHPEVWDVILTGGDPLVMSPSRLKKILGALDAIDHVSVVRIHTRLPVAEPNRITQDLVGVLKDCSKTIYVAVHSNHPAELTTEAVEACTRLTAAGIPLLGQTVLLKGVNDDVETLDTLFRTMIKIRITPYYLHHPDLAPGTSHFRVSLNHGQSLMRQLRGRLSGIALPTYVLDIPGGYGKVPIGPTYVVLDSDGHAQVEDVNGRKHDYPPPPTNSDV